MMTPQSEYNRLERMTRYERALYKQGYARLAGVDEAGRGPLAGPVVAAACVLPKNILICGVDDSKKLTAAERSTIFAAIIKLDGIDYAMGIVSAEVIDRINILQATFEAMRIALSGLKNSADYLLVDGNQFIPKVTIPGKAIIKGDATSQSIAAASILAKKTRDDLMQDYHKQWPEYGFSQHKGYPTKKHLEALEHFGPCPIHRLSFAPLKIQI
ncbi:Ribonuclease HII [Candidatus Rhabdochlamydia oedothoracis]|uniref:Ribonuclease HII n=1 Tax=Candidatus Rhabdochlamydia oedothoracis TaxID=2720720 RepID=A0ABX8V512_9BACT|nr:MULTISPECIES: ribonuclease HII [Rhabdochlamydia]KAG6559375.1 Ribonuclease HII [Candidatus Rhabdochlamydia sp. W815]MCL6756352.1 ribonuclease HII [Candidatus Rhabdochlamydia oedothoracis]QYF48530.1 Ribonuclease HII [Candidatus Rhabdochlamydia oedothoracis]